MNKRISLLALSAMMGAFATHAASAADLAPPPPPPAPEIRTTVSDWTGPYIGAVLGGTCMDTQMTIYLDLGNDGSINDVFNGLPINGCGWSGGLLTGFNYQIDNIVLGLEGDWTWGSRTGKHTDIVTPPGVIQRDHYKIQWQTSLRARVGVLSTDQTLLYLTGGISWLKGTLKETNPLVVSDSKQHTGYILGGGIEHAFTENLHLRAEYLYGSYGKETYRFVGGGDAADIRMGLDHVHTFRVGVSWNFPISQW